MCTVADGEATEFLWSKEGQLLRQNEKFRIVVSPENSVLTIRNADPSDAGIYICVAKNSYSEDRVNAVLNVEGSYRSDV